MEERCGTLDYCVVKETNVLSTHGCALKVSQVTCRFSFLGLLWGMSRAAWEIMSHSIYNQYWMSCFVASFSKPSQENSQLLLPTLAWPLPCRNFGFPVSDWNIYHVMAYYLSTFFSSHLCWCHINATTPQQWGRWVPHQLGLLPILLRFTR